MSLLISREFDDLFDTCMDWGWEPRENTEDAIRLVSPGDLAEVRVAMKYDNQIHLSVPIPCRGDPHATQYTTRYTDATEAAKFGEMHVMNWEDF